MFVQARTQPASSLDFKIYDSNNNSTNNSINNKAFSRIHFAGI